MRKRARPFKFVPPTLSSWHPPRQPGWRHSIESRLLPLVLSDRHGNRHGRASPPNRSRPSPCSGSLAWGGGPGHWQSRYHHDDDIEGIMVYISVSGRPQRPIASHCPYDPMAYGARPGSPICRIVTVIQRKITHPDLVPYLRFCKKYSLLTLCSRQPRSPSSFSQRCMFAI